MVLGLMARSLTYPTAKSTSIECLVKPEGADGWVDDPLFEVLP